MSLVEKGVLGTLLIGKYLNLIFWLSSDTLLTSGACLVKGLLLDVCSTLSFASIENGVIPAYTRDSRSARKASQRTSKKRS